MEFRQLTVFEISFLLVAVEIADPETETCGKHSSSILEGDQYGRSIPGLYIDAGTNQSTDVCLPNVTTVRCHRTARLGMGA
jgi:hypothetical protein